MTFKFMAYTLVFAGAALSARFVFAGASVMRDWGLEATEGPLVMGRRIAALYLGIAVMFFLGRDAPPSELRSAVCVGMGVALTLLAALGVFERAAGRVSSGIIVPAVIEAVFAAGFAWAWWADR